MRMIVLTRGLPASGKSTQALEWVNQDPEARARCNRDELRMALYGKYHGLEYRQEKAVTDAQRAAVKALVEGGRSVVVDDTNLKLKYARAWADLAHELGVGFAVIDVDTDVEECVRRDKLRGERGGRTVGEKVIRGFAERYAARPWPAVLPTEESKKRGFIPDPWSPTPGLPQAWLFDIDGTLAHNDGHRGWYGAEELKVGADKPWPEVVAVADALLQRGDRLLFMSGRTDACREQTADWLAEHLGIAPPGEDRLFMRAQGDRRPDDVIKAELFDGHVRGKWNVLGVFDDRPTVTRMWRLMGFRVFQCGDPYSEF